MTFDEVMTELKRLSNPNKKDLAGMARYGINVENAWCISVPKIRALGKKIGRDHELARKLWASKIHEARWLTSMVDEPDIMTEEDMENYVKDFNSWDICDGMCSNLFDRTRFAYKKAEEWAGRDEEYVKRAGFVIMAALAIHDKKASNGPFEKFLEICKRESTDERNFVRKAVNWALRQISKSRNINLYKKGLKTAYEIKEIDNKTAHWIANDAIRELESEKIKKRFI
ncbi:MAG: DNA alkylation repair protein [Patescibacteria group bacterium]|nr:DNA alkylation repair protein [Patescibacteria group bacterium]